MNIITSNPYRILGVYSNASKKEIAGAENKIMAYAKIGRNITFKSDFIEFVGQLNRSEESLTTAVSKLTLAKDKIKYSLFWFISDSALDEMAFYHITSNNADLAIQLWSKNESASSSINIAVCSLIKRQWAVALYYYAKFIESNSSKNFIKSIAGEEISIGKSELVDLLIGLLESEFPEVNWLFFSKAKNIDIAGEKIDLGGSLSNSLLAKSFREIYIGKAINKINLAITEAEKNNKKNPSACLSAAKKLSRISSEFKMLRSIIPCTDIRYTSLSDKVADIMDGLCKGYYNNSSDYRKARIIKPLVASAYSFACSDTIKEQCEEGVDFIKSKDEELPPAIIETECQQIHSLLSDFIDKNDNASLLACINNAKEILSKIKIKIGESNSEYIKQSSQVVHFAINIIVDEVNKKQKAYNDAPEYLDTEELNAYKKSIQWAMPIMRVLSDFAKDQKCLERFKENNETITSIFCRMIRPRPTSTNSPRPVTPRPVSPRSYSPSPSSKPSSSSSESDDNLGCIILGFIAFVISILVVVGINTHSSSSLPSSSYNEADSDVVDSEVVDTVVGESSYYSTYDTNNYDSETVRSQDEIWLEKFKNNSLANGSTPYKSKYGRNSKSGNSRLKIIAPRSYDVLVIIKNSNGNVAKHAYIRSNQSYSFTLRAGTYQPFFIYGNSWCPEKEAPNGEKGYFLEDVSISKDYPQEIGEYQELEYTLQVVQNGNFHAASSNPGEAF